MTYITNTFHDGHSTFEDISLLLIFRIATEIVFFRVRADSDETVGHLNIIEHARLKFAQFIIFRRLRDIDYKRT